MLSMRTTPTAITTAAVEPLFFAAFREGPVWIDGVGVGGIVTIGVSVRKSSNVLVVVVFVVVIVVALTIVAVCIVITSSSRPVVFNVDFMSTFSCK